MPVYRPKRTIQEKVRLQMDPLRRPTSASPAETTDDEDNDNNALHPEIATLRAKVASLNSQLAEVHQRVGKVYETVAALECTVTSDERTIVDLKRTIASQQRTNAQLSRTIEERDRTVAELKAEAVNHRLGAVEWPPFVAVSADADLASTQYIPSDDEL